jgi:hypothetical protein
MIRMITEVLFGRMLIFVVCVSRETFELENKKGGLIRI